MVKAVALLTVCLLAACATGNGPETVSAHIHGQTVVTFGAKP